MPNKKDLENLNFLAKFTASSEKPEVVTNTPFNMVDIVSIEEGLNLLMEDIKN
jgi:hypothetical protein